MRKYIMIISMMLFFWLVSFISVDKDLERAKAYFEVKDYYHTVMYCLRSRTLRLPDDRLMLGKSYQMLGDYKNAQKVYKQIYQRNSSNYRYAYEYGLSLKRAGQYDLAKSIFSRFKQQEGFPLLIASCDSSKSWQKLYEKRKVTKLDKANSEYSETAPVFYKGQLYFCSNREDVIIKKKDNSNHLPYYTIWRSSIQNKKLSKPKRWISEIGSLNHNGRLSFTKDEQRVYYCKTVRTTNNIDLPKLFAATKTDLGWSAEERFIFNDTLSSYAHPFITGDEKILFFSSNMSGGYGGMDIYACFHLETGWTDPINMGEAVNTSSDEVYPFFDIKTEELYFSSNGLLGMGGYDIFKATQRNGRFNHVVNLKPPYNSSLNDFSFTMDSSRTQIIFSSDRDGGDGLEDLYMIQE